MSPIKQNIIVLQEQSEETYDISLYAGNMYLNRLCIDEDAGFELSGVYLLNKGYKKPRYPLFKDNFATPTYRTSYQLRYYRKVNIREEKGNDF